jgi:hypothetical protein
VQSGEHCDQRDHWLVKRREGAGGESQIGIDTKTVKSGWALVPIPGRTPPKLPLPYDLGTSPCDWGTQYRQQSPRGKRIRGVLYDYCFECRHAFPAEDPPKRHIWEKHDALREPGEVIQLSGSELTQAWYPVASLEEQKIHERKLENMEAESKEVFKQKVLEKENKLIESEIELYTRFREMKESLEQQRAELVERKTNPETGKRKKRSIFSLR